MFHDRAIVVATAYSRADDGVCRLLRAEHLPALDRVTLVEQSKSNALRNDGPPRPMPVSMIKSGRTVQTSS